MVRKNKVIKPGPKFKEKPWGKRTGYSGRAFGKKSGGQLKEDSMVGMTRVGLSPAEMARAGTMSEADRLRYMKEGGKVGKKKLKGNLSLKNVLGESVNEGTDIYLNNRIQVTKFSGGNDGKLIQINAPKIKGSGDHIVMKIDDFKKMLKKSSNLLKQVQESLNEEPVAVSTRNDDGSITTTIKEVTDLNEQETALYEFGQKIETLMEKNCPTNPSKWSSYKSQAKQKFDVYPSAYANGWAAKKYKAAGGGWKKC